MCTSNDQQLPELFPQQYLSAGRLSGRLETSLNSSPPSSARSTGFKRTTPSPLKRSVELIRVSRHEWDYRDQLIITLRNEVQELKDKSRESTENSNNFMTLLRSCQSLAAILTNEQSCNETTVDVLISQITSRAVKLKEEYHRTQENMTKCDNELEKVRGELAAVNVKLNTCQSQLNEVKLAQSLKESELIKFKNEAELSQENQARSSSMLQSLKKQVNDLEQQCSKEKAIHTQLESHNGQLQTKLKEKEMSLHVLEERLHQTQIEKDEFQERATVADSAYEEICCQLAESLQIEDNCDFDEILLKTESLMSENNELNQRLNTLLQSSQVVELDSKANRETINRLAAEVKKYEQQNAKLSSLQQSVEDLNEKLKTSEKEKESLLNRVAAAKSNISSLEQELSAKNENCIELKKNVEMLKNEHKKEQDTQHQYVEFYGALTSLLGCQSNDKSTIKQRIEELIESIPRLKAELSDKIKLISELRTHLERKDSQIKELEEKIELDECKQTELIGQLRNIEILEKQLHQQDDKYKSFVQKCASALKVESTTSSIMAGDFAEDTILLKAEQLSKSETQALAERQSSIYSLQRKLKSCRQQLETKELQVNLLQRKVSALESRVTIAIEKETEWQSTLDKGKKMTDQLDRLRNKVSDQKQLIGQLKEDSEVMLQLKMHCDKQETKIIEMEKEIETLQENRIHLSQQLADARQKIHHVVSADSNRADECERKLKATLDELQELKERESSLALFRTNVYEVVVKPCGNDEEVVQQLKNLKMSCEKYKDLSQHLQLSLRTMETGFRTNFEDTLTLLKNEI